eukprot:642397-Pyramimonas_sp.AAC.1
MPEDEAREDPEPMVGKLLKTMHGAADAIHAWQDDYIGLTSSRGFQKGISKPAILYHAERQIEAQVHGDDFGAILKKSQEGSSTRSCHATTSRSRECRAAGRRTSRAWSTSIGSWPGIRPSGQLTSKPTCATSRM